MSKGLYIAAAPDDATVANVIILATLHGVDVIFDHYFLICWNQYFIFFF